MLIELDRLSIEGCRVNWVEQSLMLTPDGWEWTLIKKRCSGGHLPEDRCHLLSHVAVLLTS